MKTFLSADYHLGENRFELMGRPFKKPMEMIETLIENHNKVVSPNDLVYVLGDVCYQKTPEYLPIIKEFNGKKILVRGNHDKVFTDADFAPYFDEIIPEGEGINVTFCGIPCYLTHYPTRGAKDKFNLVGHIHAAWKYQLNMLNVGVDVHHFSPVDADTIDFHLKAITEFYDRDVWVAYEKINTDYRDSRGKKSTYFESESK